MLSGELLGWCPSHSSECSSVAWLQLSIWTREDQFLVRRETLWHEEEGNLQGTWLTEQTLMNSNNQWSDREMHFKNLPNWGGKSYRWQDPEGTIIFVLCRHLLKWQLPNIPHCLSRDMWSDGTSTIDFIQYISLSSLYLLRQRPLWWDEGHSMLSVMQRTQNSPLSDKIMMETRGWIEKKGLMWCKDLLPGSCMCLGFSLGPRSLLCKINSEWIVKYINLPIYALVLLSLRPSHDLIPDEAFQEWIYWGAFPFVSTSHTTYCLCSSLHLVQIGPVTAPQNVNEDIIFPCTEGMQIQEGMP